MTTRPAATPASRRALMLVVSAVTAALIASGCSSPDSGIVPSPIITPPEASTTEGGTDLGATELPSVPEVVRWGGNADQLAVVIRNQSALAVRQAGTVIEAIGADGAVVATVTGSEATTCCTVIGLQPGGEYGLFADLDVPVAEISDVRVTYVDAVAEEAPQMPAPVVSRFLELERTDTDTVVHVDIDVYESSTPYVVGQAFLVGPDGGLVGVISGRFYCVDPGASRELRMELQRPTPPGTRVERVLVHPVPDGVPPGVSHACQ